MTASTHPFSTLTPLCGSCGLDTLIRLERLVIQGVTTLTWHCLRCHAHWPAGSMDPPCIAS